MANIVEGLSQRVRTGAERLGRLFRSEGVRNVPIETVYAQSLHYHQELLQLFASQSDQLAPRLIMFWDPSFSVEGATGIESMPDKLTRAEEKELVPFLRVIGVYGLAFYVPQYQTEFINRVHLTSQETLDRTLAEEIGHYVVQIPESRVSVPVELIEGFEGPLPDFGRNVVDSLKKRPPLSRMIDRTWLGSYSLSMNEFFPPLFITHLTGQEYPISPEDFLQKRLTEQQIEHLPLLAGKMLVAQYEGNVKAIMHDHSQLTQVNGQQLWDRYCLPLLKSGRI